VGFLYPAFASYKVLKHTNHGRLLPGNRLVLEDAQAEALLVRWLTYWIVIGCFSVIEHFTDLVLFWVPFYSIFKVAFVVWLLHPQTQGANLVYEVLVERWFMYHEEQLDMLLERAQEETKKASSGALKKGIDTIQRAALELLHSGSTPTNEPLPPKETTQAGVLASLATFVASQFQPPHSNENRWVAESAAVSYSPGAWLATGLQGVTTAAVFAASYIPKSPFRYSAPSNPFELDTETDNIELALAKLDQHKQTLLACQQQKTATKALSMSEPTPALISMPSAPGSDPFDESVDESDPLMAEKDIVLVEEPSLNETETLLANTSPTVNKRKSWLWR